MTSSIFLLVMNAAILNSLRWLIAADRRAQFEELEYTDDDYQKELEHIEKVRPFLSQNGHLKRF